jgi:bifunctional oligoribonuclease and PAP phosphatase NrnA
MSLNEICKNIKRYDSFLITAHTSPEGDALGSQLGFYNLVKKLGKQAVIVNEDPLPASYAFLPGSGSIRRLGKGFKPGQFDCFVVLDCADLKRTGGVYKLNRLHQPVLNIDHHVSNQNFGDAHWVDAQASSCSEMIYRLFKRMGVALDKDTALVLYTGIMTDTGSFRYSNTASSTFKAAAELLKFGINVAGVYRQTYENIPPAQAKLLLKLLAGIKFFGRGKVAAFQVARGLPPDKNGIDLMDHILSFGRSIKGVEVVALFKNTPSPQARVRVNLRSQGAVDVNKIAAYFGGGGHKTAAGCTLPGRISPVRVKVIARICQDIKKLFP